MTYDSTRFWNGFWGCMAAAFVLVILTMTFGAVFNQGRFAAAKDCIKAAQSEDELRRCKALYTK